MPSFDELQDQAAGYLKKYGEFKKDQFLGNVKQGAAIKKEQPQPEPEKKKLGFTSLVGFGSSDKGQDLMSKTLVGLGSSDKGQEMINNFGTAFSDGVNTIAKKSNIGTFFRKIDPLYDKAKEKTGETARAFGDAFDDGVESFKEGTIKASNWLDNTVASTKEELTGGKLHTGYSVDDLGFQDYELELAKHTQAQDGMGIMDRMLNYGEKAKDKIIDKFSDSHVEKILNDDVDTENFLTKVNDYDQTIIELHKESENYFKASGKYDTIIKVNQLYDEYARTGLSEDEIWNNVEKDLDPVEAEQYVLEIESLDSDPKISQIENEINKKRTDLKDYLSTNIKVPEGKDPIEVFGSAQELDQIGSGDLSPDDEFYRRKSQELDDKFKSIMSEHPVAFTDPDMEGYVEATKSRLIDERAYLIESLPELQKMDNPARYVQLIHQANLASEKIHTNNLKYLAEIRDKNPKMESSELEKLALEKAYATLTPEEKDAFENRDEIRNYIQFNTDIRTFKEQEMIGDTTSETGMNTLKKVYNGFGVLGTGSKATMHELWEQGNGLVSKEDVSFTARSEMRSVLYSNDKPLVKFGSLLFYNPDDILAFIGSGGAIGKIRKAPKALSSLTKNSSSLRKLLTKTPNIKLTTNIGKGKYSKGVLRVTEKITDKGADIANKISNSKLGTAGNLSKNAIVDSVTKGAAIDNILDANMNEAPRDALDEFNILTGFLFDTTLIPGFKKATSPIYKKGKNIADPIYKKGKNIANSTANTAMYKMMTGDQKEAVNEFIDYQSKRGIDISKTQAVDIMKKGEKLYKSLISKDTLKSFTKDGTLYNFISDTLKHMEKDNVDMMLTGTGLGVEKFVEKAVPFKIHDSEALSKDIYSKNENKSKLAKAIFEKSAKEIEDSIIKGKIFDGFGKSKSMGTKNRLEGVTKQEKKVISDLIQKTRNAKTAKEFAVYNDELQKTASNIVAEKAIIKPKSTVAVRNLNTGETINITLDQLEELQNINSSKAIKDGIIDIKDAKGVSFKDRHPTWKSLVVDSNNELNRAIVYVKSLDDEISNFVENLPFVKEAESFDAAYNLAYDNIKQNIVNIIARAGNSGGKIDPKYGEETAKFIVDKIQKFYGKKTSSTLDLGNVLVPRTQVIDKAGTKNTDFVITWGRAEYKHGKGGLIKNKADNYLINIYPGKKLQERYDILNPKINPDNGKYLKSFERIRKMIHHYTKDGDYETAYRYIDSIEYYGRYEGLINGDQINKKGVKGLVQELGNRVGSTPEQINQAQKIIIPLVEKAKELDPNIVGTMVTSYTYKYLENFELITKLLAKSNFKADAVSIFADILINPKIYNDIAKKMDVGNKEYLTNFLKSEFDTYKNLNQYKLNEARKYIKEIKAGLKVSASLDETVYLENMLKQFEEKADDLKKVLNMKPETYIESKLNYLLNQENVKTLKSISNEVSASYKYKKKYENQMTTIKNQIESFEKLNSLTKEQRKKYLYYLRDFKKRISNKDFTYGDLVKFRSNVERSSLEENIKQHFLRTIDEYMSPKFEGMYVNRNKIIQRLQDETDPEIYSQEFLDEGNPFVRKMKGFVNSSISNRDFELDRIIYDEFDLDPMINLVDNYHSNSKFKEFIDGFQYTNDDIKKSARPKSYKQYEDLLRKVFKNRKIKVRDKNGNIVDKTDEILKELLNDESLKRSFKNIPFKKSVVDYSKDISDNYYDDYLKNFESKLKDKGFDVKSKDFEKNAKNLLATKYEDYPLLISDISKKIPVTYIDGASAKDIAELSVIPKGGKYPQSIKSLIKKDFNPWNEAIMISDIDAYSYFMDGFNGKLKSEDVNLIYPYIKELLKDPKLKGISPKTHIMVGGFGDKDSYTGFYTNKDFSAKKDYKRILEDIYVYDYAIASGLLKESFTMKQFKKALGKTNFEDYKDFKDTLDEAMVGKKHISKKILKIKDMMKREASLQSSYKTFDKVDKEIRFFVMPEDIDKNKLVDYINNNKVPEDIDDFINEINALGLADDIMKEVQGYINKANTSSELKRLLEGAFNTNKRDGATFASKNLGEERSAILGSPKSEYQFKDHITGLNNGSRYLIKTNINNVDITFKDGTKEITDDIIVSDIDSLKLSGGINKDDLVFDKEVTINGKKVKVAEVPFKLNTQDFVEATMDSKAEKTAQSASESILAKLDIEYQEAMYEDIMEKFADEFEILKDHIGTYSTNNTMFGTAKGIHKAAQRMQMGSLNDATVTQQVTDFMKKANSYITDPREAGQKMYIQQATRLITPQEIIVSKESNIYKTSVARMYERIDQLRNDMEINNYSDKVIKKYNEEIERIQKDIKSGNIHVVAYRFPVPTKFNLGTYKLKVIESNKELYDEFGDIGPYRTIMHPQSAFLKIEADFDADTLVAIPTYSKTGEILSKASLDADVKMKTSDYHKMLVNGYENKFIPVEQVEAKKLEPGEIKEPNLFSLRNASLTAKENVSIGSATGRTIGLINTIVSKANKITDKNKRKEFLDTPFLGQDIKEGKLVETVYTYKDLIEEFQDIKMTEEFFTEFSSALQVTLDYAKSGLDEFPSDTWLRVLATSLGKNLDEMSSIELQRLSQQYNKFISPISKNYGTNILDNPNNLSLLKYNIVNGKLDINKMHNYFEGKVGKYKYRNDFFVGHYKTLIGDIGMKREVVEKFLKKYGEFINNANSIGDINFIINNWADKPMVKTIKSKYIRNGYFNKENKENFLNDLKKNMSLFIKDETTLNDFLNKGKTGKFDFETEDGRILYAVKELAEGNYHIFDLLTDEDKFKYMNFFDTEKIKKLGPDFEEKIQVKKDINELQDILSDLHKQMRENVNEQVKNSASYDKHISDLKQKESIVQQRIDEINNQIDDNYLAKSEAIKNLANANKNVEIDNNIYTINYSNSVSAEEIEKVYDTAGNLEGARKEGVKLIIGSILRKYDLNLITSLYKHQGNAVRAGLYETLQEYNRFYFNKSKKAFKKLGLKKKDWEESWKKIQGVIAEGIVEENGKYKYVHPKDFHEKINKAFEEEGKEGKVIESFIGNEPELQELTQDFVDKILPDVLNFYNQSKKFDPNFNLLLHYNKKNNNLSSMIVDTLSSAKSDFDFGLKMNGFYTRQQFRKHYLSEGVPERSVNAMANSLYGVETELQKLMSGLKNFYYSQRYGLLSNFGMNGQYAGMTQYIPNLAEVLVVLKKRSQKELEKARVLLERENLLAEEDSIRVGGGGDAEYENFNKLINKATNGVYYGMNKIVKFDKEIFDKAETFVSNPLAFYDHPLDKTRKIAALVDTAKTIGMDLDELNVNLKDPNFRAWFEGRMKEHYAGVGGGVISGSRLERDTIFTKGDFFGDDGKATDKGYGLRVMQRFASNMIGFLNGWAFAKNFRLIEKMGGLTSAIKNINNPRLAYAHMSDFMKFNMEKLHIYMMGLGIYLKLEKYEDNPDQRHSYKDFVRGFHNSAVAFDILFGQAYDIYTNDNMVNADGTEADFWDKTQYLGASSIKKYMRTVTNTSFVAKVYKDYNLSEDPSLYNSFVRVTKDDSLGYSRWSYIADSNDIYGTLEQTGGISYLGLGVPNTEQELTKSLMTSTQYAKFDQLGFVPAIMKYLVEDPFIKTLDNGDYGLMQQAIREDVAEIKTRAPVRALLEYGLEGEKGYKLERILGVVEGKTYEEKLASYKALPEEYKRNIDSLYKVIKYNEVKDTLDSKGYNKVVYDSDGKPKWNPYEDVIIVNRLKDILAADGIDYEQVIKNPQDEKYSESLMKSIAILSTESNIKASLIVQKLTENYVSDKAYELKKMKKKYGDAYEKQDPDLYPMLQHEAMMKFKDFMMLDGTVMEGVLDLEVKTNQMDALKHRKFYEETDSASYQLQKALATDYMVTQGLKEGNTSVLNLKSKFKLGMEYLPDGVQGLQMALNLSSKIDNSTMTPMDKVSHKAGLVLSLKKEAMDLLKNSDKFDELVPPKVRRWISNLLYDISSDAMQLDSNSLLNEVTYASKTKKGYNPRNYKSFGSPFRTGAYGGTRPNFAKQFEPIQQLLKDKTPYISNNPKEYLREANAQVPQDFKINILKFGPMKKYSKYLVEAMVDDFYSKNVVDQNKQNKSRIEKPKKGKIKIRKAKTIKQEKPRKIRRQTKVTSKGLNPNLPLSRSDG